MIKVEVTYADNSETYTCADIEAGLVDGILLVREDYNTLLMTKDIVKIDIFHNEG